MLYDGISDIADDWRVITGEINRLNSASSKDEVILIHNAVDTNTVLVIERATTLLKVTFDNRNAVFLRLEDMYFEPCGFSGLCGFSGRVVLEPHPSSGGTVRSDGPAGLRAGQDSRDSLNPADTPIPLALR